MVKEGGYRAIVPPRKAKRISKKVEVNFRALSCFLEVISAASQCWPGSGTVWAEDGWSVVPIEE